MKPELIPKQLDEIEACLKEESCAFRLREGVLREVGRYTVALLPMSQDQVIGPGATGTLVSFLDSHYLLTAAHVWEEHLKKALRVAITLKEKVDHRYLIDSKLFAQFGPTKPGSWNEWGPDIALLCIPPTDASAIMALGSGVFYNLSKPRQIPRGNYIEERLLMGLPKVLGKYEGPRAELYINGIFLDADIHPPVCRAGFDFKDLDVSYEGALEEFGGVSGGGLWRIFYHKPAGTGEIESFKVLDGVAFFHIASQCVVRCHGPKSIGTALRCLF